jgi:hypothetical protein
MNCPYCTYPWLENVYKQDGRILGFWCGNCRQIHKPIGREKLITQESTNDDAKKRRHRSGAGS